MKTPRVKKPLKKYGTDTKNNDLHNDIFDFRGESDGDVGTPQKIRKSMERDKNVGQEASMQDISSTGDPVSLETPGLLAAKHSKSKVNKTAITSMPPPASKSTSLEQTPKSESIIAASMLDPASDLVTPTKRRDTAEDRILDSVYSDGRMPTPTMSSRGHRSDDMSHNMYDANQTPQQTTLGSQCEYSKFPETKPNAPILSADETAMIERSALITSSQRDEVKELSPVLAEHHGGGPIELVTLLPKSPQSHEVPDELSVSVSGPLTWSINQATMSKSQKSKPVNDGSRADEPDSDDIAIGLPKDQYQPRPSRSRSSRGNEDVIIPSDFSKRPEAIAKKSAKSKRRKTTAFHELMPKDEDDQTADDVPYKPESKAPEFSPLKTSQEPHSLLPDRKHESVIVASQNPGCPEPVMKPTEKKKGRGRPKKGAAVEIPDELADDERHPKDAESEADAERKDEASKKKGKNKAKAKPASLVISEELVNESDDELANVDDLIRQPKKILEESQGNTLALKAVQEAKASPSPTKIITPVPETPRKITTSTQKGPDKHSPISSGKVAYRVGLSKRARIAPLLRIVRKA